MKPIRLKKDEALSLACTELLSYPFSQPKDLFKAIYQCTFGPFHISKDAATVATAIYEELCSIKLKEYPLPSQMLGSHYLRLNFYSIPYRLNKGDLKKLSKHIAEWMVASCKETISLELFIEDWLCWQEDLRQLKAFPPHQWDDINTIAKEGAIPSHSVLYKSYYDPHYRLVNPNLTDYYKHFLELINA